MMYYSVVFRKKKSEFRDKENVNTSSEQFCRAVAKVIVNNDITLNSFIQLCYIPSGCKFQIFHSTRW